MLNSDDMGGIRIFKSKKGSIMKIHNKFLKTILSLAVIAVAIPLVTTSCNSLLNDKPLGQQTSKTFFKTKQDAIDATNATYQILRTWQVHVFSYLGITDIISDDANKGSTPTDASFLAQLNNLNYDAGNLAFKDPWTGYYKGIYRANLAIQNIPKIKMDQTLKDRLIAENKFLRAYFYFFLERGWHNVPLITKPLNPNQYYNQPNASPDSVYAQIISDLQYGINHLPEKSQYSASDLGRATKGAAEGMLAKVYLYRQDYKNAEKYADMVINSGQYSLLPDYSKIFTRAGENSSGTIFSVQNTATSTNEGGSQYDQVQGVRGNPNLGWGFNNPSKDLIKSYSPGDPRQESTVLFVWEELPDGTGRAVHKNPNMVDEDYNQKAFVSDKHPGGQGDGPGNIRILRYADVLLIKAEAAYQNGETSTAQKYLNMVQDRARNGRTATIGASIEPVAPIIADTLGMSNQQGKPLLRYVWPGSAAAKAGMKSFSFGLVNNNSEIQVDTLDIVQSVNGQPVNSVADYMKAMKNVSPNQSMTMRVMQVTQTYDSANQKMTTNSSTIVATMTAMPLLPNITATGKTLLHDIWHERRSELAMEQHRWFDLLRQNKVDPGWAAKEMAKDGKNFKQKNTVFPIPQTEIDLSNGALKQNPLWK